MLQKIIHGANLDIVSRGELEALLRQYTTRQQSLRRVRAPEHVVLDATGTGTIQVYKVPAGYEFEVRRVILDLSTATENNLPAVTVSLAGGGLSLQYLRSGTRIEWGNPASPAAVGGGGYVPGSQTWGKQQGPSLRNGEVFQIRAILGAGLAGVELIATVEGILSEAGSLQ